MGELDATVEINQEIPLGLLSTIISQLNDRHVLALLADLDRRAASWDFTIAAAKFFTGEARKFDEVGRQEDGAITRVAEFVRQADLIPNGDTILSAWTDPNAQMTQLTLADLRRVLDLATIGAAKENGDD